MRLKSPSDEILCVSLTNGTGIRIGPDGREVPAEFLKASFAEGAIPEGVDAEDFDDSPEGPTEEQKPALLIAGIKTMLTDHPDKFTGAGLPNRNTLSSIVGWNVSVQELSVAWQAVQDESAK